MSQWTAAQQEAIAWTGGSLLVSAAAGSGKTSVLAERCCHLITDAKPHCSVDQLLVVTFAEEAAAEMKQRIEARLASRYLEAQNTAAPDAAYLRRQTLLAPAAHISTLHAFCARLIRRNFHLAGLDPAFRVLDAEESRLMQAEILEQLFEDELDAEKGTGLRDLMDRYGDASDLRLRDRVRQVYETLRSVRDAALWRGKSITTLEEAAAAPDLNHSRMGQAYLTLCREALSGILEQAKAAKQFVAAFPQTGPYGLATLTLETTLQQWVKLLEEGQFDEVAKQVQGGIEVNLRGGPRNLDAALREQAKGMIDAVRDPLKKGSIRELFAQSQSSLLADMRQILPHARYFLQLTQEFEQRYQREKNQINALDFSDLEHVALRLLGQDSDGQLVPTALARELHQRYHHVLVDEYQDINEVQDAILHLVSRECVRDNQNVRGNLFCVGDVKQSIYRFRLADPGIFLSRRGRYLDQLANAGKAIDLRENFRSRRPLLDAINSVFVRLMRKSAAEIEYDQSHAFRTILEHPIDPHGFTGVPIELQVLLKDAPVLAEQGDDNDAEDSLDDTQREAQHVASIVREMLTPADGKARQVYDKQTKGFRDITASDVVVLLRSIRRRTREYARAFARAGIAFRSEGRSGFFDSVEVQDVLSILKVLDNQQQDIPLAAAIRSPVSGVSDADDAMARIRLACKTKDAPFHQAVAQFAQSGTDTTAQQLRAFLSRLETWRLLSLQRPTEELISTLYRDTSILLWYAGLPNGEQRVANLQYLHECAAKFAQFQRQGLYRFLKYLAELEEQDSLSQPPVASDGHAVRLMSIHASKGLEFPVVVVAGLGTKFNMQDLSDSLLIDRQQGIALRAADMASHTRYPTMATRLVELAKKRAALAEELRILYVAMTRARECLLMVGSCTGKQLEKYKGSLSGPAASISDVDFLASPHPLAWLVPLFANGDAGTLLLLELSAPAAAPAGVLRQEAEVLAALGLGIAEPYMEVTYQAIARLTYQYPQAALSAQPAALSVSMLSKQAVPLAVDADGEEIVAGMEGTEEEGDAELLFPPPGFLAADDAQDAPDGPAARGIAMHTLLQQLDFSLPPDKLESQVDAMVKRKSLTKAQAGMITHEDVIWLLQSDLGKLLAREAGTILREVPFLDAVNPPGCDDPCQGLDRVMLRGRIDALVPQPEAWLILDYKTDWKLPDAGSPRDVGYRRQVEAYRQALARALPGMTITAKLVFIRAKQIVDIA